MKNKKTRILAIVLAALILTAAGTAAYFLTGVRFADRSVEKVIRATLNNYGRITDKDMEGVVEFRASGVLGENELIYDISDLSMCRNLQVFEAAEQPFDSISALSGLDMLLEVDINGCENLTDLSPLDGKHQLKTAFLHGVGAQDASMIMVLPSLRELSVSVRNIDALSGSDGLELFHSTNLLDDVSPLYSHIGLKSLRLKRLDEDTFAEVISAFPELTDLTIIYSDVSKSNVELINSLTLERLSLMSCPIETVETIVIGQPGLASLTLRNCSLGDISALARLSRLEYLNISSNEVDDMSPLAELHNLQELVISEEDGHDLAALAALLPGVTLTVEQPEEEESQEEEP